MGPAVRPAGTDESLRSLAETARRLAATASLRPAWSDAFAPGALDPVPRIDLAIDKGWAWGGASGAGVTVAVVDSGVDAAHPAVGAVGRAVALRWDADAGEVVTAEGPHDDLVGHGTACAGIIRSAAPDAAIWSVRVLGSQLMGKGVVFAAGLRWAITQGASGAAGGLRGAWHRRPGAVAVRLDNRRDGQLLRRGLYDGIGDPAGEQASAAHAVRSQYRAAGRGQKRGGSGEQAKFTTVLTVNRAVALGRFAGTRVSAS